MKRRIALLLVLALLVPAYIWAWTAGGGSAPFDGNLTGNLTITSGDIFLGTGRKIDFGAGNMTLTHAAGTLTLAGGQLLFPGGTSSLPSVAIGEAGSGFSQPSGSTIEVDLGSGGRYYTFDTVKFAIRQTRLDLQDGNVSIDAESSGVTQFGLDAAAAVAQTLKGPDGSGADAPGAKLTLAGGRPTGTGRQAPTCIASATTSAVSSSTQQTLIERFCVDEKGISLPPVSFANLGNTNGYLAYCTDCDAPTLVDSTCTSSGGKVGSLAIRVNGTWKCIS